MKIYSPTKPITRTLKASWSIEDTYGPQTDVLFLEDVPERKVWIVHNPHTGRNGEITYASLKTHNDKIKIIAEAEGK